MSAEPRDAMNEVWGKWQGRAINGVFRLGSPVGSSEHSAVFGTQCDAYGPAPLVVKLIPSSPLLAQSRLAELRVGAALAHPHLIRLLQAGQCELDGQSCLYIVMERADQNLAQLLRQRTLTTDEARELLAPSLAALAFLHAQNLVQGQVKPANLLALGDQLKLASDTIRGIGAARTGGATKSVYDPPEAQDGSGYTAAGDIWGLGVSLFEALAGTAPESLREGRGDVALPRDFAPQLRELVSGCLSRRPYDRPKVAEVEAWLRRNFPAPARAAEPPAVVVADPAAPVRVAPREPVAPPRVVPREPAAGPGGSRNPRALGVVIGALVALALAWAAVRAFRTGGHEASLSAPAAPAAASQPQDGGRAGAAAAPAAKAAGSDNVAAPTAVLHQEIPDVPHRARQTIHGRIRVSVRVIVDPDGKVVAALVDQPGPSRYFERLAVAAARKWTFAPAPDAARRVERVRFEFSRDGASGRAAPVP